MNTRPLSLFLDTDNKYQNTKEGEFCHIVAARKNKQTSRYKAVIW